MPPTCYPGFRGPNAERRRQQKEKPEAKTRASGLSRWESRFHVINLASVPSYREPIRIVVISDVHGGACVSLRSQSETRFKIWTKYRYGSEILNGRGQRPFSSLQVFPFTLSLRVRASGTRVPTCTHNGILLSFNLLQVKLRSLNLQLHTKKRGALVISLLNWPQGQSKLPPSLKPLCSARS